jgi:hypothetical protein
MKPKSGKPVWRNGKPQKNEIAMGFFSFKKQNKILEILERTPKFDNRHEADKHYGSLRGNSLDFVDKVNFKFGNKFDYTPESLGFLQQFYIELDKTDGYKKQLDLSKNTFRTVFGIYRMEVYVRNFDGKWSVDRFFESDAYTYGVTVSVINYRGFVLPDAALGKNLDFYKQALRHLKE